MLRPALLTGDQPVLPKQEEMLPEPLSPYAVAKLVGEYYCQVLHEGFMASRPSRYVISMSLGQRQDPGSQYSGVISRFISALISGRANRQYLEMANSRGDFTYVDNVVEANLRGGGKPGLGVGRVINIGKW